MNNEFLYIANWKMQLSYNQAIQVCKDHFNDLAHLSTKRTIVLCPSFDALAPLAELFKKRNIHLGAQTCATQIKGAFTGQVSAQSLQELGCTYCIVGHSEQRQHCNQSNELIAQKVITLLHHNIKPIVCIGEHKNDHETQTTFATLEKQLTPIFNAITQLPTKDHTICIAYEPIWSIGTGVIPEHDYLQEAFDWLAQQCNNRIPHTQVKLLYGGSVNENNSTALKKITGINGFLIGSASTDFKKFEKIVS